MDLGIAGKTALITGASRGIGRASAFALAREGVNIVIAARGEDDLVRTAEQIRAETGVSVLPVVADVADADAITRLVAVAGSLDILVAICGSPKRGAFDEISDADFSRAFEATTLAVVRLVRAVVPHMRESGWGRIVTVQARSVKEPIPDLTASNATRPGVAGLMKDLARDFGPDGILVNTIVPGRIMTDRFREGAEKSDGDNQDYYQKQVVELPVGRFGEPEEIADMVAFLASERASYVTGAAIRVDGGLIRSYT